MSYIDEILARIPTNGVGEIAATDVQECFTTSYTMGGRLGQVIEGPEGLEKTGYRLYEETETYNYTGDTGESAVDVSTQTDVSILNGSLGDYSFVTGYGTRATADNSVAFGKYNLGLVDSSLEVGIGTDDATRANAITVYTDGTAEMPEATNELIEARGPKALATKEYADAMTFSIVDDYIVSGDYPNPGDGQKEFIFFQKATYVQVFGDGIKHSINDSNNSLTGVAIDNSFGATGKITVTFLIGQPAGTYIEVICFS